LINQVGVNEAQNYQGWLKEYGKRKDINYTNATLKTYITAAVSFYEFLKRKHLVYTNPFREIRRAKVEEVLPRNLLKEKEMNLFLKELSKFDEEKRLTSKVTRFKVYVVAELMYSTGLRIAEASNLKLNDIDFDRGLINVADGKMGFSRVCFLNEYAEKLLRIYINEFRELTFNSWNKTNSDLLFGVKWSNFEKTINKVLKKISIKLKYPKFTSHAFRHCLGYHLLRSGCDVRHIQAILGHKLLRNTEVYTKVDKEELKEVFDRFHPRTYLNRGKDHEETRSRNAV
jgi:site-specific recombinase XerD